jgi:hypothetical protein
MKATRAFPDYDNVELFATLLDEFGGYDDSWKNDSMPSMVIGTYSNTFNTVQIRAFIDYADQEKRDVSGYSTIAVYADIEGDTRTIWEGEPIGLFIDDIKRAIAHYINN